MIRTDDLRGIKAEEVRRNADAVKCHMRAARALRIN
jgi:hypothetical protein